MLDFWVKQEWPRDAEGHVFMARALQAIGRALFNEQWSDTEYTTEVPRILDAAVSSSVDMRRYARALLKKYHPDLQPPGDNHKCNSTEPLTRQEWRLARDASAKAFDEAKDLVARKAAVEIEFISQSASEQLRTFYRPLAGGQFVPIPAEWWNTEQTSSRFQTCQINRKDPFSSGSVWDYSVWIFVGRDSLRRYIDAQPRNFASGEAQVPLSPYLRLMLSVAEELNVTPQNQPKKTVVVETLFARWVGSERLSDKLVEAMATLIREPESQLGRARKKHEKRRP